MISETTLTELLPTNKNGKTEILHLKCKVVGSVHRNITEANQNFRLNCMNPQQLIHRIWRANVQFMKLLILLVTLSFGWILLVETLRYYVKSRCRMFGGRKCIFPFDLMPDWLDNDSNFVY